MRDRTASVNWHWDASIQKVAQRTQLAHYATGDTERSQFTPGTTANEYSARLLEAAAPISAPDPVARVCSLLVQWQQQGNTPIAAPSPNDGTLTPSEALFREWEQDDATLTDEAARERIRTLRGASGKFTVPRSPGPCSR